MRLMPTSSLAPLLSLAIANASSGDVVRINEVLANPFGTDVGQEFIELSGTPGLSMAGLTLIVLEGDAEAGSATQKGRIDNVISLEGLALGSNGLLLLRDGAGVIDTNPDPSQVTGPAAGTTVVLRASTSSASGFGNLTLGLENSSITVVLVRDFTGAAGNDLDTNDDGVLDITPWSSVVDAVSIINSSSAPIASSVAYAPSLGFPSAVISRVVSGFDSGLVARGTTGAWFGARTLGVNPTLVNPTTLASGPYFWEPGFITPAIGGVEYLATPGQLNGTIPNADSVCGNRLVTGQLGAVSLYNNWGFPTLDLTGSPVALEGASTAQKIGAARQVVFTAAAAGVHRFQLCGSSVPNTVMVATTACAQPVTAIAANNDSSLCTSNSTRSAFDISLGAGDVVYLAIGSYMATSDPFPLSVGVLTLRVDRDRDGDGVFDDQDGCPDNANLTSPLTYFIDGDLDTYGSSSTGQVCSQTAPSGYSTNSSDCNDSNPNAYPGAPELCNGIDDDCDTQIDEGLTQTFYGDADGDGAGDPAVTVNACSAPTGYVAVAGDACPANGALTSPVSFFVNVDGDGYGSSTAVALCSTTPPSGYSSISGDCNDGSATVYPGAPELCATVGIDNNCNGNANDVDANASDRVTFFSDADGDAYTLATGALFCSGTTNAGYRAQQSSPLDCNDASGTVYPGAPELCATVGVDNNCNGNANDVDANASDRVTFYTDADGDTYTLSTGALFCSGTTNAGYRAQQSSPLDCNDSNSSIYPGAPELCNGVDEDCSGTADDNVTFLDYYLDSDGDGFGAANSTPQSSCNTVPGRVTNSLDCNDGSNAVYPGAPELCATVGVDNNCNGSATDVDANASDKVTFFSDADGDAYTLSTGALFCSGTTNAGYRAQQSSPLDCNDASGTVYPGAPELCATVGVDNNCNGNANDVDTNASDKVTFYTDADSDTYTLSTGALFCPGTTNAGYRAQQSSPLDCNDASAAVYPGAPELCANLGIDNNCNGDAYDATNATTYFRDADQDGYGNPNVTVQACTLPFGYVSNDDDCNDGSGAIYPGAPELCATVGVDNDCDGDIKDATDLTRYFRDSDQDGYGDPAEFVDACSAPSGYVANSGDGCPSNPALIAAATYYRDTDGDGYGVASPTAVGCTMPDGYAARLGDSCPSDPGKIAPGSCGCGVPDTDSDNDGYADCLESALAWVAEDARPATDSYVTFDLDLDQVDSYVVGTQFDVSYDSSRITVPTNLVGFVVTGASGGAFQQQVYLIHTPPATAGAPGRIVGAFGAGGGSVGVRGGTLVSLRFRTTSLGDCNASTVITFNTASATANRVSTASGTALDPVLLRSGSLSSSDGTPPTLVGVPGSSDVRYVAATSPAGAPVPEMSGATVTAQDNCPGATVSVSVLLPGGSTVAAVPAVFPIGQSVVTWTATDLAGNTSSASRTVVVEQCVGSPVFVTYYRDGDSDGYGLDSYTVISCAGVPAGFAVASNDCNDSSPTVYPGAPERCSTIGIDNNCNGNANDIDANAPDKVTFYSDSDGDGFTLSTGALFCSGTTNPGYRQQQSTQLDCNDSAIFVYPGAPELCSTLGTDNNCNGNANDIDANASDRVLFFSDSDGDGYTLSTGALFCPGTSNPGYRPQQSAQLDCNDASAAVYPGAPELCATIGVDNNCNGDAYDATDKVIYYTDADGDGFTLSTGALFCPGTTNAGYRAQQSAPLDCNDAASDAYPGAQEVCDTRDNDCDGQIDENLPQYGYYPDTDSDGYGAGTIQYSCSSTAPAGLRTSGNDNCPSVSNPSQADCNGDGVGDACETGADAVDCDSDGTIDSCEIIASPSLDLDRNGTLDTCQGAMLMLNAPGSSNRAPGSSVQVEARVFNLTQSAVGLQLYVEWDTSKLTYVSVAAGDNGFNPLGQPVIEEPSATLRRLRFATGQFFGPGVTSGILARVNFTVAPGAESCAPLPVLRFAPPSSQTPPYVTRISASGGTSVPFTGVENVLLTSDSTAPVLAGVPASVTVANAAQSSSPELLAFTSATVTATDNCGPATVARTVTLPSGAVQSAYPSPFPQGVTTVRWTATDASGNTSVQTRTVTIEQCVGGLVTFYRDADRDGYGVDGDTYTSCASDQPADYAVRAGDCNDTANTVYPGAPELCATVGTDNNCNGNATEIDAYATDRITYFSDADGDSYTLATGALFCPGTTNAGYRAQQSAQLDCNDASAAAYPGAPEVCATLGTDNNCNGNANDVDAYAPDRVAFFTDADNDSYTLATSALFCAGTTNAGYRAQQSAQLDCNDASAAVYPGAPELCSTAGTDNNCNGNSAEIDAYAADKVTFFSDADNDSYTLATGALFCPGTTNAGYRAQQSAQLDCNDSNAQVNPAASESCNGVDDNCNGQTDEGVQGSFYADSDGDGYGNPNVTVQACTAPSGFIATAGDCNDAYADSYPGAAEVCDGRDNNCNTLVDEGLPTFTYYADTDGDGYGAGPAVQLCSASAPAGYSTNDDDNCPGVANPAQADCNGDGVGDACETGPDSTDCNDNDVPDACELASNPALDSNGNGIIDSCDGAFLTLRVQGPTIRSPGSQINVDVVAEILPENVRTLQLYVEWDIYEMTYVSASGGDGGFAILSPAVQEPVSGSPNLRRLRMATGLIPNGVSGGVLARLRFNLAASPTICGPTSLLAFAPPSASFPSGTRMTGVSNQVIPFTPFEQVVVSTDSTAPALVGVPDSVTSTSGQTSSGELAAFVSAANAVTASDNCANPVVLVTVTLPDGTTQQSIPSVFPVGVTTITWKARDTSGNESAPQSRTVTVDPCPGGLVSFYPDSDGDGYGTDTGTIQACANLPQPGFSRQSGDCNDSSAQVYPGASESCNGIDDNCNGQTDEGVQSTFYANVDGDAYGNPNVTVQACSAPSGFIATAGDCNDAYADSYPGAAEVCDGRDNNCNTLVDEGLPTFTYYADTDGDGYGAGPAVQLCSASAPAGYSTNDDDNCPGVANPAQVDCNGDGVGDACPIAANPDLYDCNSDGALDTCELEADPNLDLDGNGIIDDCQGPSVKLTTAASTVEPDGYFYVDLSETRFDVPVVSGSFRLNYDATLIDYIVLEGDEYFTPTLIEDSVTGGVGLLRFTVQGSGAVSSTTDVIMSRILVKASGGPLCEPESIMWFSGGTAQNTVSSATGPLSGYTLYEKAIVAFDVTGPVIYSVPANIYAYAGAASSMVIPPYANADVYAIDACGAGLEVPVSLRVTLPDGSVVTAMPAQFPLGMSVVRWTAVDAAGNIGREIRIVEVVAGPPPACSSDIWQDDDSTGVVDGDDLAFLMTNWDSAGGPADINGDGIVDATDLSYLLGAWGPCPQP